MKDAVQEALQTSFYGCFVSRSINFWFQAWKESTSNGIIDTSQEANLNTHVNETGRHSDFLEKG